MNTATTDRHSKRYHARQLNTAAYSMQAASQVVDILRAAFNADDSLSDNGYFLDTMREARERADEMEADYDYRIAAAIEDGFGPDDFS